jgi:DNA-binding MarR family transcriptional regulator/GNAT superfamily N-acetyltransferase
MPDPAVAAVRRFNRAIPTRIGALSDRFLGRERPMGEARLLWEIGPEGCEVRALRERLGLDSAYVSRLLRALEAAGLVTVGPGAGDRRVRVAHPTDAGHAEREVIDARSDDFARSLLAPLDSARRDELVAAMGTVERLLTASLVTIEPADPGEPEARRCLAAYSAELDARSESGFDPAGISEEPPGLREPAGVLLLVRLRGEAVGCGALEHHPGAPSEIQRLWLDDAVRGLGLGRRLLGELEARARRRGAVVVRLWTNRALTEAIALYRASGYAEVPAFNDESFADHCFEKRL